MSTFLPKYEDSEARDLGTQDPNQEAAASDSISVPSEISFAQEVRSERLGILWKITLFAAFMVMWVLIVVTGGREVAIGNIVLPIGLLSVGCLLTGQFLSREKFTLAVWSFALGATFAVGFAMSSGGEAAQTYIPFILPILVFMVGLLISVRGTLALMAIVTTVAIVFPSVTEGKMILPGSTMFALGLTALATGLSAQVSGELFAIAEWALENYRKERRTTFALFESRLALEKSFHRQTALTHQLQDANKQLEMARKAEEEAKNFRGQFLANMSHELRTPLNAIIGFSQTMLDFPAMYDGTELPAQYRQDMNQVLGSGKHLLTIINDILDLSKVDAGKLDLEIQPVDLAPVVKGVMSTAVGLVGEKGMKIQLLRELADPLPMALGDPLRIRQVLLNLYSNAAKFTDSGHIKLRIWAENGEVIFGVEDTGIGIMDADKATIFEEFRQGTAGRKKGRQGAGLGLAISQQLLRLMQGRIWFESVVGKGSTFYFALPQYVPETTKQAETPATEASTDTAPAAEVVPSKDGQQATAEPPSPEEKAPAVADVSG